MSTDNGLYLYDSNLFRSWKDARDEKQLYRIDNGSYSDAMDDGNLSIMADIEDSVGATLRATGMDSFVFIAIEKGEEVMTAYERWRDQ